MRRIDWLFTVISALVLIAWAYALFKAHHRGLLMNALNASLMAGLVGVGLSRISGLARGNLDTEFLKSPFSKGRGTAWVQILPRWVFWILAACVAFSAAIPTAVPPGMYQALNLIIWGCLIGILLLCAIPKKPIAWPMTMFASVASIFLAYDLMIIRSAPKMDIIQLASPFEVRAIVSHGGMSPTINYHVSYLSQQHALDMGVPNEDGSVALPVKGTELSAFGCFGQPLLAPAQGVILKTQDGLPDQAIGSRDPKNAAGNYIILDIGSDRYVLMGHMQQGSIQVKEGQAVAQGDVLGACGNSGNTSEPHLHIQVQDKPEFGYKGITTFPIMFKTSDGYAYPRRNDWIQPAR